ncbi:CaiB/BaiF CoA transferase family protein [Ramlibacter albus]|uniref:CoA transferase n=1 Tax=Ramlibacter albus TaxID=2079448 RepID=A0A923MAH3_9BURK|nr:CoA transferase [Ramlibacter albus]MBC5767055.1 CoA transferase [Ramlibacter albus]
MSDKETPLRGLRIADFSHFIAGPFATMILADMGAEVIKIESAGTGDNFRHYPPHIGGESVPYLWVNRNKKSVALDLKTPEGRAVALDIVAKSDVVVENFSTGVMERLGLDWATLSHDNPRLIYASVSSYGRRGPYANRIGFDPVVQAESGFISMNGDPAQEPGYRAGPSVMDIATAMMTANAIQGAWIARLRTGRGQLVETTMIETAINMLGNFSLSYLATGVSPTRFGNTQATASPVGAFETATGPIYLACANDRTFQRLARDVLLDPALADDPAYATSAGRRENQQRLLSDIRARLKQQDRDTSLARMHEAGVPCGAIRTVGEAMDAPEIKELGLVSSIAHPTLGTIPNVGLPMHFSETPLAEPVAAPLLGADTDAVLRDVLGYAPERISGLREEGVFG